MNRMMRNTVYVYLLLSVLFVLSACSDDEGVDSGSADSKVTIELSAPTLSVVTTRAATDEEAIENVAVFVFKTDGNKRLGFTQSSSENIRYIDVYLSSEDESVYVVCNYPNPESLVDEVATLDALKARSLTISAADGAYPGYYVMTGHTTVAEINTALNNNQTAKIPLYRIAAHLNFTIKVNTSTEGDNGGDGGDFKMTDVYICNVPRGSWLLRNGADENDTDVSETGSTDDYVYNADATTMRGNYFGTYRLSTQEEDGAVTAEFDMFENRRGSVEDVPASWPELTGLEGHEKYKYYKQLYKRNRAVDYPDYVGSITIGQDVSNEKLETDAETGAKVKAGRFYNATYLRIDGVYQRTSGATYKTSYYVYLGGDNFKDFNIRRNYWYNHEITIKAHDDYEHRVTGELLGGLTVYATLDDLDAHCNSVKALMYAPEDWTVEVENPDETPWLEVSHSSVYKPRLIGQINTGDEAAFSISGTKGLTYFYIHTDDYIPDIDSPEQNATLQKRTGTIVCKCKNVTETLTVTQLPAQMVVLNIKFDLLTFGAVADTFFIERKLEQKYIPWGYYHYWSFVTDNLISTGTWDGLSNTRKLYDVGLNGQKKKDGSSLIDPAYEDGLPYDHAIGYVVQKNRDRNGNGKIDYDEIMWYWPATKELKQIYETKSMLSFEGSEDQFHASTPSAADPAGVTPGFSYSVRMSDGKTRIVQRDRRFNVLACRRKGAWRGPDDGNASGNVTKDEDWDDGDEVIIPKAK